MIAPLVIAGRRGELDIAAGVRRRWCEVMQDRRRHVVGRPALGNKAFDEPCLGWIGPGGERVAQAGHERVGAAGRHRLGTGQPLTPDRRFRESFDRPQRVHAPAGHERQRLAAAASPARPADAMDIVFGIGRKIVVDHQLEAVHVDSAGGDVGCDQEPKRRFLEAVHHASPLGLRHPAMKPLRGAAPGRQHVGQFLDHPLRVAENQPTAGVVEVDESHERGEFLTMLNLEADLLDQGITGGGLLRNGHRPRLAGMPADERLDGRGDGRREEDRLPCGR